MTPSGLGRLIGQDLRRTRGPLVTAGVGIAVGVAAFVFFLALGLGARAVLLGDVFPINQLELEPQRANVGLIGLLGDYKPPTISAEAIDELRAQPGVRSAYPKLRFRFPSKARGGKELIGRDVGTGEMMGDGVDPVLVTDGLVAPGAFSDPLGGGGADRANGGTGTSTSTRCETDKDCMEEEYCERPSGSAAGWCSAPVPVVVSRYLVELFDHGVAPAHGLPPIASQFVRQARGVTFDLTLGRSLLGKSSQGEPRRVKAKVVGVSSKAIDIGITLPLEVVRRWNQEYEGEPAGQSYSSVIVELDDPSESASVIGRGAKLGLVPSDTRARDVSVLLMGVLALLGLVAIVVLGVAAMNIAHTFRMLVAERGPEIGLYRALGATARDMRLWMIGLALVIGAAGGAVGVAVAWLASLIVDWRAAIDLPEFPFKPDSFFVFPWWLFCLGVGFAALFALLGAIGPARRAAKTDPAIALAR